MRAPTRLAVWVWALLALAALCAPAASAVGTSSTLIAGTGNSGASGTGNGGSSSTGNEPDTSAISPAERSLLNGVRVGQETLFRAFDVGFAKAFGEVTGAGTLAKREHAFLAAVQAAGTRLLERGSGAALSEEVTRAGRAWQAHSGALLGSGRMGVFIRATAAAEIAFWKGIAGAARAYRTSSDPATLRAAVSSAEATFAKGFQRAVGGLLKGAHTSRAGRAGLLRSVGLGVRGFSASVNSGALGFANLQSAPNNPGPPPAPPSTQPTPSTPVPQTTQLSLHCPANAHVNEALRISGTLAPAPEGASVELLYYPPPSGAGTPPPPIHRQLGLTSVGEFTDASVTPETQAGGSEGKLEGTWMVEATYTGSALYLAPIPRECEIHVER